MLVQEARTQRDNFDAVVAAIKPVLDCVDLEPGIQPDGRRQCSDEVEDAAKKLAGDIDLFGETDGDGGAR